MSKSLSGEFCSATGIIVGILAGFLDFINPHMHSFLILSGLYARATVEAIKDTHRDYVPYNVLSEAAHVSPERIEEKP